MDTHVRDPESAETETDRPLTEVPEGEIPEGELVPEDDTVIGTAFKWSLIVIGVAALVGTAVWFVLSRPDEEPVEATIETVAPRQTVRGADPPDVPFTEVTAAAGIDFAHYNGARGEKLLPETMGGGGGFVDVDLDGDPDLVLIDGTDWPHSEPRRHTGPSVRLYRNEGDGTFEEITEEAGFEEAFYGMGLAVGDVDGDGLPDLYVTAVGPNRLYRNVDGTRFEDVTERAGVAGGPEEWSTSAAFFDADGDGDLDLFVGNYVRWSKEIDFEVDYRLVGIGRAYGPPVNYEGTYPYLFRNEGDGTFTDVSDEAGIRIENPATGVAVAKSLGVVPVDIDRDGAMDVFVANDTVQNFFFHNRGDGTFEETAEFYGLAYDRNGAATGAMGVDVGEFRNDGELGILIGNFANEMTSVYVSQGDPTLFADESITEGIGAPTRTALSFGLFLFDFDLDGRLDVLQANGHLEEEIDSVDPSQTYAQPAQLFWNAGLEAQRTFVQVPREELGALAKPIVARGSTYADIDGDGDLDVLLFQTGGPPLLARNDQDLGHHWLRVRLVGPEDNPLAIGARVELTADGVSQTRRVVPSRSYLSQIELPATFGLGSSDRVDSLVVVWPDGTRDEVPVVGVDRELEVTYGDGGSTS